MIAGLICAAELARAHGSPELAQFLEEQADWIEAHLEDWTVTNDGVLLPDVKRHYMRIRPPECGEPYAHDGCGTEMVHIANRGPGEKADFEAREVVDGGFLELVRYGVRRADDPLIVDSLKVVDHVLKMDTPKGPAGDATTMMDTGSGMMADLFWDAGQGRAWPLLTGRARAL